ncbi:hypothetical protein [Ramlibacter sp. AN1133]|uniref:hypothetical protein n=1 Tax=Ramlibacter sp. AN1133 TaxID=3133429 RepID=UPI0030BBF36D
MDRVPNDKLVEAALAMTAAVGKPLTRLQTGTRAMKYSMADGKTVRIRTCNDHVLVVLASSAEDDATLNIEGTDYLLVAMPEVPRRDGPVVAYFLPTSVAVADVRSAHTQWLQSGPATRGNNKTWNLWFDDGPPGCSGFAERWAQYRLPTFKTPAKRSDASVLGAGGKTLGDVIARARAEIAAAAGVPVEAVKITVALA